VIAITEGGVIPATLVYLGGFYKGMELGTRLAWFWGTQQIASAVSGLMASGLLQLRGRSGLEGWKWLFLVDGIITIVVAVATWSVLSVRLNPGSL
jgi:sugar phosphate permease